jgi:hypothetical protein
MNSTTAAVAGRAPARRKPTRPSGSHSPGATRGFPVPVPRSAARRPSTSRAESPSSTSACRTHWRNASGCTYGRSATVLIDPSFWPDSWRTANTIRTARSRSSSGYLRGAGTALLLPGIRASARPGAVQPAGQAAPGGGQLRHPQAPRGQGLAGAQPAGHAALHPDQRVVAEHGRDLLLDHHPPGHRRGSFGSVKELVAAIGRFIDGWNERCRPFVWTRTADELLDHCRPGQRTSFTRH